MLQFRWERRQNLPALVAVVSHCLFSSQHLSHPMRDASVCPPSLPPITPYTSITHNPPTPTPFPRLGLLCKVIKRVRGGPGVLQSRRVTRSAGLFSSVSLRDACDARVYSCASPSVVNKHCGPFIHTVGVEIRTANRSPSFQVFIPHCQHCSA